LTNKKLLEKNQDDLIEIKRVRSIYEVIQHKVNGSREGLKMKMGGQQLVFEKIESQMVLLLLFLGAYSPLF